MRKFVFRFFVAAVFIFGLMLGSAFGQIFGESKVKPPLLTGRIAVGKGASYGERGLNAELGLLDYLGLSGGIGKKRDEGRHWVIGARLYSRPVQQGFNPRISVFYGAVGEVDDALGRPVDVLEGYSLGAGFDWWMTDHISLDFDTFLYRGIEDVDPGHEKDEGKKIAIGLGLRF